MRGKRASEMYKRRRYTGELIFGEQEEGRSVLSHEEEDIVEIKNDLFTSSSFKGSVGMFLCKMGIT